MRQVSIAQLHELHGESLGLAWIAGRESAATVQQSAAAAAALIGHANLVHPHSIQVLGAHESSLLAGPEQSGFIAKLLAGSPAAVILADGLDVPASLLTEAERARVPLLTTTQPPARVIERLARALSKALAETTERHGVFMDVLGIGVMVTGDSGVGKSELALELISRGHGLVADDIVEISRFASGGLEGRCPPLLKDFLEVRGLGLLNIRTIFGETAVRPKMKLKFIAHLERPAPMETRERLPIAALTEDILGIAVRKVVLPVAPGRNLAVLLEAAVRNHILQLRGIDTTAEFLARQSAAIARGD